MVLRQGIPTGVRAGKFIKASYWQGTLVSAASLLFPTRRMVAGAAMALGLAVLPSAGNNILVLEPGDGYGGYGELHTPRPGAGQWYFITLLHIRFPSGTSSLHPSRLRVKVMPPLLNGSLPNSAKQAVLILVKLVPGWLYPGRS